MLQKMPGDGFDKFANLRAYYGFMWGHPGKKLLFMGQEFAQGAEWNHNQSLDWHLLEQPWHGGMQNWVRALNHTYAETPSLYATDCDPAGFYWLEVDCADLSVYAWVRQREKGQDPIVVVSNFTPTPHRGFRLGVPNAGRWEIATGRRDGLIVWRLSRADVAQDGAFSDFAGLERILTVVSGSGMELEHPNGTLYAAPWDPVRFDGSLKIHSRLKDGPLTDLK